MKNFLLNISYLGTNFHGFAKQPTGIRTIQNEIEKILSEITGERISLFSCGRTDKYVHAIEHYSNFKVRNPINDRKIFYELENKLPSDIKINSLKSVSQTFHARFSCKEKTYLYKINTGDFNFFEKDLVYQLNKKIKVSKLKKAKKLFIGEKNFLSFSTSELENTIRTINSIEIKKKKNIIEIYFNGTGFLRNMVRMIVANLIAYAENKISLDDLKKLIDNPKKGSSILKAPGCGLYLFTVSY